MIECTTLYGAKKFVPRVRIILRPAAYAIILHNEQVLLVRMQRTGKYALPGGGVESGEKIEEALRREVREETGLEIEEFVSFSHAEIILPVCKRSNQGEPPAFYPSSPGE